jgi:1,4-dihydroxy-2-naphthoate octaprenyltransferase
LEGIPVGALRDSTVAIAVGAGLAVHRGLDFAWQMPLLLLAGIAFLLVGGRILLPARKRARAGASVNTRLRRNGAEPTAGSVSPQRLGTSLVAAGGVCFLPLFLVAGTPLIVIAVASGAVTVFVLSGLMPFAIRSHAEALARLGLTTGIVGTVVLARGGSLTVDVVIAGLQLGILAALLGAVDNLRDLAQDRKTGRKTLAVCFGVPVGRFQVGLVCLVPLVMGAAWVIGNAWGAALLPLAVLPLAAWVIRDVNLLLPGPLLDGVRPKAAAMQLAFGGLLAVGLAL